MSEHDKFDPDENMEKIRLFTNRDDVYPQDIFETLFFQAPVGIALIDSITAHIYEVNSKYCEITRRTRKELLADTWINFTHPDDVQVDLDNMADMNSGKTKGFEMRKRYIQPNGNIVWIHMIVASIHVLDLKRPRHLCMIFDVTSNVTEVILLTEIAAKLVKDNEEIAAKLIKDNKETAAKLVKDNEEIAAKLIKDNKETAAKLVKDNKEIAAKLVKGE